MAIRISAGITCQCTKLRVSDADIFGRHIQRLQQSQHIISSHEKRMDAQGREKRAFEILSAPLLVYVCFSVNPGSTCEMQRWPLHFPFIFPTTPFESIPPPFSSARCFRQ